MNPPLSSCGTPQANSTFSRPRAISPAASESTLPCSAVMIAASSSAAVVQQLAEREQDGRALATAAACATRAAAALARCDRGVDLVGRGEVDLGGHRPVAGLYTGAVRPEVPRTVRPSIQWEMRVVMRPQYDRLTGNTISVLLWYKT